MTDELSHRDRLVALRDDLTARLPTAADSYAAGIAWQLQAVLGELAGMADPDVEPDALEQIKMRRAERRGEVYVRPVEGPASQRRGVRRG